VTERVELALTDDVLDAIAGRAAAIVLEALGGERGDDRPYLSVAEAADLLRAKRGRVYDLLSSGRLTRFKDGSRVLVSRAEVEGYLRGERP
jgi:excisionase family DNA binding protein